MVYILTSSRVLITHDTFLAASYNYDSRKSYLTIIIFTLCTLRLLPNPNLRKEKKRP